MPDAEPFVGRLPLVSDEALALAISLGILALTLGPHLAFSLMGF